MPNLDVTDATIGAVIDRLRKGEWLIPKFQRDFVWSTDQVSAFVHSIIEARPIGMVTLWEQSDDATLDLEAISIPDNDPETNRATIKYFTDIKTYPRKRYAVLDGRQRCTSIAMAFAGFRAAHGNYKYSGRYFLDVNEPDPRNRIRFIKEADIKKRKLNVDAHCIREGLFPLASNKEEPEELFAQWLRYLKSLREPSNYADGKLPSEEDLQRRDEILQQAFRGISETKLAVYIVSEGYSLSDICDIFETLNTTGTKVSTVDLIHSWLYSDTSNDAAGPFQLREWISDFGDKEGAVGWASATDRPELMAQIVTACYVALDRKIEPRPLGRGKTTPITSVKSGDLLATPVGHWKAIKENDDFLAKFLGGAQLAVAGGYFSWTDCPYPVSLAIYVGLRWHHKFDDDVASRWGLEELDALFKAFFWRNALARRYDQGFLTQLGVDLIRMKEWLNQRPEHTSSSKWAEAVEKQLIAHIERSLPSKDELIEMLTNGNQGGALQKALLLLIRTRTKQDLVDTGQSISYPHGDGVDWHHIYPKDWCRNNKVGPLSKLLDVEKAGRDWVNSVSNLMPLSRKSNNSWSKKNPAQFIEEHKLSYRKMENILAGLFIDEESFNCLQKGDAGVEKFWRRRAELIAEELKRSERVIL